MNISNQEIWNSWVESNQDDYGSAVIRYAEAWADLMEQQMSAGASLEDIAEATSNEADTEGITGFMYGCAVQLLATCWEFGEQLRRWHNIDTQIHSERELANEQGGVLNPALLSIG